MGIYRFSPSAVNMILEDMGGAFELNAILEQDPVQAIGAKLWEGEGFSDFSGGRHLQR
jgi:hypothetical protein